MAIDTAPKRRGVAHVARRWSGAGVTPNASKPVFWRQSAARGYGGIAIAPPVVSADDDPGFIHPLTLQRSSFGSLTRKFCN